jgi:hypothetical protein
MQSSTSAVSAFGSPSTGSGAVVLFLPFIDDFCPSGQKSSIKYGRSTLLPNVLSEVEGQAIERCGATA